MKYSNEQIRGAILRAADGIERQPERYNFWTANVPDCGTKGCMLGWIAYELGTTWHELGPAMAADETCVIEKKLYSFCFEHEGGFGYHEDPKSAVISMRAYADKFYPAAPTIAEDRQLVRWDQCAWQPKAVA